jgi:hypothetical protein
MSDMREAHKRGLIAKLPCHNSVLNALENPDLAPILHSLITESSRPLKAVETDFAVDSSGFTTCRFESWFDHKYDAPRRKHTWVKAHVMCGVKTNVVTAVEIHDKDAADNKQLPALVEATAKNFALAEVSADKAYGTVRNADTISNPRRDRVHCLQGQRNGDGGARSRPRRQRRVGQDVRLLPVSPRRVHGPLSQAVERRDHGQHD